MLPHTLLLLLQFMMVSQLLLLPTHCTPPALHLSPSPSPRAPLPHNFSRTPPLRPPPPHQSLIIGGGGGGIIHKQTHWEM